MKGKKSNHRKRYRYRRRHHKKFKKNFISSKSISYHPDGSMFPFPPRYNTRFTITGNFYVNAGHISTGGSIYFGGNQIAAPFNTNSGLNAWVNPDNGTLAGFVNYIAPVSASSGTVTRSNQFPTGLSNLIDGTGVNAPYTVYLVNASRIMVDIQPQTTSDVTRAVLIPIQKISNDATQNVEWLQSQKYAKCATFSSNKVPSDIKSKKSILTNYITTKRFFGLTKAQAGELDPLSGSPGINPPANEFVWRLCLDQADQQNTTGTVTIKVRIDYYVTCLWADQTNTPM